MTTLTASPAPAPGYLDPGWRYAGNDWTGDNALQYIVWSVPPVYDIDGVTVITPGVRRDVTGCTVSGALHYQPYTSRFPPQPQRTSLSGIVPTGSILGDPTQGEIALSLARPYTGFPAQSFDAWGDPARALLLAEPMVTDPGGTLVTIGLQPLFVFGV